MTHSRWLALVAILATSLAGVGCSPNPSKRIYTSTYTAPDDGVRYSPRTQPLFEKAVRDRGSAIREATAVLEENAKGKPVDPDLVCAAAEFLGDVRADDSASIAALIANLEFSPPVSVLGEADPLECLDAARALRKIGGRRVADALVQSLRNRSTIKKQLIVVHLLAAEYTPEVASFRLALAIQDEQTNPRPDSDYLRKLRTVKSFLDRPESLYMIQP